MHIPVSQRFFASTTKIENFKNEIARIYFEVVNQSRICSSIIFQSSHLTSWIQSIAMSMTKYNNAKNWFTHFFFIWNFPSFNFMSIWFIYKSDLDHNIEIVDSKKFCYSTLMFFGSLTSHFIVFFVFARILIINLWFD